MANNEYTAEMNKNVHICSSLSSNKDATSSSDPQHLKISSESVSSGNCVCNVNIICSANSKGNSNFDNKDIDEDIINNKQRVKNENIDFNISVTHNFSEADFYNEDQNDTLSDELVCIDRTSEKPDSPEWPSYKSDSPERSGDKSDSSERSNDKSNSTSKSSDMFDCPSKSSNTSNFPMKSSDVSDGPVKSSDVSNSPVKSSDVSDSPVKSSDASDSSERSRDKSDSTSKSSNASDSNVMSSDASYSSERSRDKSDSTLKSSDASHRPERSRNKPDSTSKSNDAPGSPDRSRDTFGSPERSSDTFGSPERSGDESGSPERSADESGSPERSGDESNCPERSGDESDCPERSGDESDCPERSGDELDCPERSGDESDCPERSGDESDCPERSGDESDCPERSDDESDSPERSDDESDSPERSGDESDSSDWSSDISDVSDILSNKSDSPEKSSDRSVNSIVANENSDVPDKTGKNSEIGEMSGDNSDSSDTTIVNYGVPEKVNYNSDSPDMPIKETENSDSSNSSPVSLDTLSNNLTDRSTIKLQTDSEKAGTVELCVKRMLEKSKIINSRKVFIPTTGGNSKIAFNNLSQARKEPFNTENSDFQVAQPFVNVLGVIAASNKIINCPQSNNYILKCPNEKTWNHYKVMYLTREDKHSGVFLQKPNDELDVNCVEKAECTKSDSEYQTNNTAKDIQVSFPKEKYLQLETSSEENSIVTGCETNELIEGAIDENYMISISNNLSSTKINLGDEKNRSFILDETLGDETARVEVTKNSKCDNANQENCIRKSQQLVIDNHLSKQSEVGAFSETVTENNLVGSQVEDIEPNINESENDRITENLDSGNKLDMSFNSLNVLKNVKEMCDSVLDTFHSCINSIIHKAKLKILPDSTPQTNLNADTNMVSVTESIDGRESINDSDDTSSDSFESKAEITNFYILFKHLTAEAGTDVTAEQVKEDINQQVVLDIYNGFHELRTADYGNLVLMEKCIRGCLGSLQNTMLKSYDIVKRSGVLLRVETRSLAELQELNHDLNELADDAEAYLSDIDRSLTGLKDFTEDYMYYKDGLNKELVEFLMEDFPNIFK